MAAFSYIQCRHNVICKIDSHRYKGGGFDSFKTAAKMYMTYLSIESYLPSSGFFLFRRWAE